MQAVELVARIVWAIITVVLAVVAGILLWPFIPGAIMFWAGYRLPVKYLYTRALLAVLAFVVGFGLWAFWLGWVFMRLRDMGVIGGA